MHSTLLAAHTQGIPMSGPKTPEEALEHIRAAAETGQWEFAPSPRVEALQPWTDEVCEALRAARNGKYLALVTDDSRVLDFLRWSEEPEDKAWNEQYVRKVADLLGIPVASNSYVADLAEMLSKRTTT